MFVVLFLFSLTASSHSQKIESIPIPSTEYGCNVVNMHFGRSNNDGENNNPLGQPGPPGKRGIVGPTGPKGDKVDQKA